MYSCFFLGIKIVQIPGGKLRTTDIEMLRFGSQKVCVVKSRTVFHYSAINSLLSVEIQRENVKIQEPENMKF